MAGAAGQDHGLDSPAFRDGLARSLADGSFRLVIVLDSAPDELVQVVGYLQSVTDKIDIDLVTVAAYDVGGSQVLVPQRIDPGSRPRQLTNAQVDARQASTRFLGSTEFRAAITDAPAGERDLLERACDWAETLEQDGLATLMTTRGSTGLVSLLPQLADDHRSLVIIYRDRKSAYLMFNRSVFERCAPHSIPAVEAALGTELTSTHTLPEGLLDALTTAYREARQGAGTTSPPERG
jgi:hypothetical protein